MRSEQEILSRIRELRRELKDFDWAIRKYSDLLLELELAELEARGDKNE